MSYQREMTTNSSRNYKISTDGPCVTPYAVLLNSAGGY